MVALLAAHRSQRIARNASFATHRSRNQPRGWPKFRPPSCILAPRFCIPGHGFAFQTTVTLPDATFPSSRAQNRGFCALLPFGTPVFGHFEHKIEVFVRFCQPKPSFSGFSSTKSRFLCVFTLQNPRFRAFRAQNRGFCALLPVSFSRLWFLWAHCQQHLPDGYPPQLRQSLRHGAPASNKPHPAEKSTPVWLAIWHIWAGFANSQLQCATFHSTYSYKFTSSLLPTCNRCSDIANLSARLHRLPTPPPYLRWMRLSPGRWRRSLVQDEAVAWPGCRCWMLDMAIAWPVAAFLQITARANPCSRHLWGTLARAVASI